MVGHGVSDAAFGVAVDDGGEIQPAFSGGNVGNVGYHFLAGGVCGEIPVY
jgi:hypothetical protein